MRMIINQCMESIVSYLLNEMWKTVGNLKMRDFKQGLFPPWIEVFIYNSGWIGNWAMVIDRQEVTLQILHAIKRHLAESMYQF